MRTVSEIQRDLEINESNLTLFKDRVRRWGQAVLDLQKDVERTELLIQKLTEELNNVGSITRPHFLHSVDLPKPAPVDTGLGILEGPHYFNPGPSED